MNVATGGNITGSVVASLDAIKAAFTEWDRRYREEPERFMSEAQHLLKETPETYGDACAPYFVMLINEAQVSDGETIQPDG